MSEVLPAGTVLAQLDAIADGAAQAVDLNGDEFPPLTAVLVRSGADVHAYFNRCPHAGRPLNIGAGGLLTPDGELLQCHAHGALFEKHTGVCIAGPCVEDSLRRLPVTVIDGRVCLAEALDLQRLARAPW